MSESDLVFSFTSYTELCIDSPVALQMGQEAGTLLTSCGCAWIGGQCLCYSNLCLAGKKCWTDKHIFPHLLSGLCAILRLFLLCCPTDKKSHRDKNMMLLCCSFALWNRDGLFRAWGETVCVCLKKS